MKVILFANTDWYLYNFRLSLAKALIAQGDDVILLSPPGPYVEKFQNQGYHWEPMPFEPRGMKILAEVKLIRRLIAFYQREKPDLVHHFTIKCMLYGSMAAHLTGVKRIINSIEGLGHIFTDNSKKIVALRQVIKLLYRIFFTHTKVIFLNPEDRETFIQQRILHPVQAVLIKGSGVDVDYWRLSTEPEIPCVVVLAARMFYQKGIREFVQAAGMIKKEGIQARFVLVGDSQENATDAVPGDQLRTWQGEGIIEWWGWQQDMRAVYEKTHIACLPSFYREGLPKSLLEAAACGRPLIATDIPGCREIVRDGENGFLIPPKDVIKLTIALKKLIGDRSLRQRMGQRARQLVEEEFSDEKVNSLTLNLYRDADFWKP